MPNMLIEPNWLGASPWAETRLVDLIAHKPPAGCSLNEGFAAMAVPLKDDPKDLTTGASTLGAVREARGAESIADAFLLFLSPSFFFRLP